MNSVSQPFNPEKFNFTKVQSKEVRSQLSLLNQSEQQEFPCGFRAKKDRGTARNGIFWFWPPQKWNEWPLTQVSHSLLCGTTWKCFAMQAITQLSSRNKLFHVEQLILVLRMEAYKSLKEVNKNLLFSLLYPQVLFELCPTHDTAAVSANDDHHLMIINVSPMEYGHSLLVPSVNSCLPQVPVKCLWHFQL